MAVTRAPFVILNELDVVVAADVPVYIVLCNAVATAVRNESHVAIQTPHML